MQRRKDGSQDFSLNWLEYENGFGNVMQEFWWGNKNLHELTSQADYKLRIDLEDWNGNTKFAIYNNFMISAPESGYMLTYSGYDPRSTLADSLTYPHKGKKFTTKDRDNDGNSKTNCAQKWSGGWWYGNCFNVNLNGPYKQVRDIFKIRCMNVQVDKNM